MTVAAAKDTMNTFSCKAVHYTSAEKCQKNRNFFLFSRFSHDGVFPLNIIFCACDAMRFVVRLFIQACALPVGFACFLKEKTLD